MVIWLKIILKKEEVENWLIIYADKNIWQYHFIIADININFKEQMIIISIKLSIQYFIYQVFLKNIKIYSKQNLWK